MARLEGWEGREVVSWERGEGSELARWKRWDSSEATRWEVPWFYLRVGVQSASKFSSFCFSC